MTDQWERNRLNFEGVWQGKSQWYVRQDDGELSLDQPTTVVDDTRYAISFEDADTGLWDGTGLFLAPGGAAQYPLSRSTYNGSGACWQFEAAGGQSSLEVPANLPRFGHEINLFHGRSRSMLVLLWKPDGSDWRLNAIGAVAFRCQLSDEREPARPQASSIEALLAPLQGCSGVIERFHPQPGLSGQPSAPEPITWDPQPFLQSEVCGVFADGLVCGVPERLPSGGFRLEVGCLQPSRFQQLSIVFDQQHKLQCWERRLFPATFEA